MTGEVGQRVLRASVPEMDALLGTTIPVLGGQCFIRVVDYMGSDAAIVQAARVSYGEGTKTVRDDRGLIRYLLRKYHTTPFEMCSIKLHALYPMDVWRQWIRHRTASVNEYSTRASEALDNFFTPADGWRLQDAGNRMGSDGFLSEHTEDGLDGAAFSKSEKRFIAHAKDIYNERIKSGIAREQARKDLPLSTFSMAYWKIDLHNLLHFLRLRLNSYAQYEIRMFAEAIAEVVKVWVPHTWEAFEDYRLESMQLTRLDKEMLKALHHDGSSFEVYKVFELAKSFGWMLTGINNLPRSRERDEFEAKLIALTGWKAPWR